MIATAAVLATTLAAQPWIVRTQTNVLGQPETVAEMPETPDAAGHYLKFSCSVMSGPVLEVGLGARSFEEFSRFSAQDASEAKTVGLTLQWSSAILTVTATPVPGQVTSHAYAIAGSDAVAAARAIESARIIGIASPDMRADFDVSAAAPALAQALEACPFKG